MLTPAYSKDCFRGFRLIGFSVGVVLILLNGGLATFTKASWEPAVAAVFGLLPWFILHVCLVSGFTSSNRGSYFRDAEPVRYWLSTSTLLLMVLLANVFAWFLP